MTPRLRRTGRPLLCSVVAVALTAALAPAPAAGAPGEDLRWAVTPSGPNGPTGRAAFEYDVQPGQQITDMVGISNLSDRPVTFTVYATDAYTTGDGGFGLLPAVDQPKDAGSWTDLTPHTYTVNPKTRADVQFHLTVPRNATPGDHAGGIIASVAQLQTTPQGQQVNVDRRIAARIYLRVGGPVTATVAVESVHVDYANPALPFGSGGMTVTYLLKNTGNVRVHGTARVRVRGLLGVRLAESDDIAVPELLPGAEISVSRKLSGVMSLGRLTATVTVNPESREGRLPVASANASVWASPWALIGLAVAVLALIALGFWLRARRRALRQPVPGDDGADRKAVPAGAR